MAKSKTPPRFKPSSLDDLVPYTDFTARQLTRVATAFRQPEVGMILSRDGAWDHKYVIMTVAITGMEKELVSSGGSVRLVRVHTYELGILNLGVFNSDLRMRPASRFNRSKCTVKFPTDTWEQIRSRGNMRLGIPIGHVADPSVSAEKRELWVGQYDLDEAAKLFGQGSFWKLPAETQFGLALEFKVGKEAGWAAKAAEWKTKHAPAPTPPVPRTPEAILADFLIN